MDLRVPSADELVMLSPVQVERVAHELEITRRRVEAASALMVLRVDQVAAYAADGHRGVGVWGRATNNWSGAEAAGMVKLAKAFRKLPKFAQAALAGELGVAQMHAVAKVAANPRVAEHLAEADELFTTAARDLPFDDFVVALRHWEELADADGARSRHDRAVRDRRASVHFVGVRSFLDAQGPAFDGVIFEEVLAHYVDLEWQHEWDLLAQVHGEGMHAGLMERTHSQRSFDALQRIFAAAGAGEAGSGPAVTVDIVIDQATFEHQLETMLGGDPAPIPPSYAPSRRCEDAKGRVVDPRAVVAASLVGQVRRLVIAADGVVLNMGRRQRLFTGQLREAVLLSARRCTVIGCTVPGHRCQADHLVPAARGGPTDVANGGPACRFHNPFKNNGTRTIRDAKGRWHTYRPDGTEIGWPTIRTNLRRGATAVLALGP
ncbi:MAG: DUF222 domain-containing protein [Actinobacteria bacterium]|nr:DUF222 domain-containing protein [Actinomycetota bacterium]